MLLSKAIWSCRCTQLSSKVLRGFSHRNNMKTIKAQGVTRHHNIFRFDEYHSFGSNSTELEQFTVEESKIMQTESSKWAKGTEAYFKVIDSRRDERIQSIPERYDMYEYMTRVAWFQSNEYTKIYRKRVGSEAKEELALDIMAYPHIARNCATADFAKISFSPSHRYIAFGVDLYNNQNIWHSIVDTKTNKLIDLPTSNEFKSNKLNDVEKIVFKSEKEIYYVKSSNHHASLLVYLNLETGEQSELFQEDKLDHELDIKATKDRKYLIISSTSKISSDMYCIAMEDKIDRIFQIVDGSTADCQTFVEHIESHFVQVNYRDQCEVLCIEDTDFLKSIDYLSSRQSSASIMNFKSTAKRVLSVQLKTLSKETLHKCAKDESIVDIDVFKSSVALYIVKFSRPVLRILNLKKSDGRLLVDVVEPQLPLEIGTIKPGVNQFYESSSLLIYQSNPFASNICYEYSLQTNKFTQRQPFRLTGPKFYSSQYSLKTIAVPATDNQRIPLTLVTAKSMLPNSPQKMLLVVYGFYGLNNQPEFCNGHLAALENGWSIGYAHVRGGGECGKSWHKGAMNARRHRTWSDLEDIVAYLLKEKLTHPSLLFLSTNSAGAIAVWNAINRAPHLYKGVILYYPFLDILSALLDSSQPLTHSDHGEFGNPITSKRVYMQLQSISPYETIEKKEYPLIHIIAGEKDYRCPVSQIAKLVKRFRTIALPNGRYSQEIGPKGITVRVQKDGSHLGMSSLAAESKKICDIFAMMDYVIETASNDCKEITI